MIYVSGCVNKAEIEAHESASGGSVYMYAIFTLIFKKEFATLL